MATLVSRSYQLALFSASAQPTTIPDPAFPECAFTISLPVPFSDDMDTAVLPNCEIGFILTAVKSTDTDTRLHHLLVVFPSKSPNPLPISPFILMC